MPELSLVQIAADRSSHIGPFEPPVAEQLGVEGRAEHRRDRGVEAGPSVCMDQVDEVAGVLLDPLRGLMRPVDQLLAHVDPRAGDLPVAMATGKTLLVEVEIVGVAGIAGVSRPHLQAGAGIAGKDRGGVALVVRPRRNRSDRGCAGAGGSPAHAGDRAGGGCWARRKARACDSTLRSSGCRRRSSPGPISESACSTPIRSNPG